MPKGIYERRPGRKMGPKPAVSKRTDCLIARYYREGYSRTELAKFFGLGERAIRCSLRRTGTVMRPRMSYGEKNGAWNGGRTVRKGYVYIHSPNHPYVGKGGYVAEHRLVMEKILGRFLKPEEVVHHKNKKRADNRPANLVLFANNRTHLAVELMGRRPRWTADGRCRIAARRVPSMKGIRQCKRGTGARLLRRKLIQASLRGKKELRHNGPVASLPRLPFGPTRPKKGRGTVSREATVAARKR